MLSAAMLSWILGARRFTSIARICDSRTPVTVTSCNSSASLAFLASGGGVVAPPCCAGSCVPSFCAVVLVGSDAMADVAAAASNAMDMAIDRGCLRYTFDTAFPSRLLSFGSQMPYGACSAYFENAARASTHWLALARPALVHPDDQSSFSSRP